MNHQYLPCKLPVTAVSQNAVVSRQWELNWGLLLCHLLWALEEGAGTWTVHTGEQQAQKEQKALGWWSSLLPSLLQGAPRLKWAQWWKRQILFTPAAVIHIGGGTPAEWILHSSLQQKPDLQSPEPAWQVFLKQKTTPGWMYFIFHIFSAEKPNHCPVMPLMSLPMVTAHIKPRS